MGAAVFIVAPGWMCLVEIGQLYLALENVRKKYLLLLHYRAGRYH